MSEESGRRHAPEEQDGRNAPTEQNGRNERDAAPLSPYQCSVHLHTTFCDGKGTPAEMAAAAYRAGVRYLGFSGHSHTPLAADAGYVMDRDTSEYRRAVLDLRREYAGRMEVLLGIEWDLYGDSGPAPWEDSRGSGMENGEKSGGGWDYCIGSVHHIMVNGTDCPIDNSPELFALARDSVFGGDMYAFAEAYYRAVAETAAHKPTILGHIDLVTKFIEHGEFFDETDGRYRQAALSALGPADPAATLLEINTGAMSRGYRSRPYPAPFLLEAWRRRGGRVILTADAHSSEAVLYGYDAAAEAARAAGYTNCAVLTAAGVRDCPL